MSKGWLNVFRRAGTVAILICGRTSIQTPIWDLAKTSLAQT